MICGHQLVTLQRGGDDQAVGRVTVHVRQKACPGRDPAIDGDFDQSLIEQIAAPGIDPKTQIKMAFLDPHANFPEGNGRNSHTAFLQRALKHAASSGPPASGRLAPATTERECRGVSKQILSAVVRCLEPFRRHRRDDVAKDSNFVAVATE